MRESTPDSDDAREVLILVNPTAGGSSSNIEVGQLVDLLEQSGYRPSVLTDLDDACGQANQKHKEGTLRALVGVGGDGTVATLVNRTDLGVPITILPTGNENLLARHLGLRRSAEALAETIAGGRLIRLDAGSADGRIFLLMIGCGFDAEVVRRFEEKRTGHVGYHSYVGPLLGSLSHYEYSKMLIYCGEPDGPESATETPDHEVHWLFAFNLPCYGGGLRFTPGADATDGLLDVCTFRRGSTWHGLRYFSALALRRHGRLADCELFRTGQMRIEAEGRVPYQLDGDFAGYLPVEVEVVPERLTFVVPEEREPQMDTD